MAEDYETEMEEYMSDQQGEGENSGDDAEDSQGSREGSEDESDEETDNPDDPKEQVADESRRIKRRRQTASSSATPKKKGRPESHAGSTAARAGTASTSQVPAVAPAPTAAQSIAQDEQSSNKGEKKEKKGDCFKFNTARKLNDNIELIRRRVEEDLRDKNTDEKIRQCAVATYFIDRFSIRVGTDKNEDMNDGETVGCCTMSKKNVKLKRNQNGRVIELDLIGKCKIPCTNCVEVLTKTDDMVFKYLKQTMESKESDDALFDELASPDLTKYLQKIMEGLTPKVFRTCHASRKMEEKLKQLTKQDMTEKEKVAAFRRAKTTVAYHLNHIRTDAKGNEVANPVNTLKFYIDPRIVVCWCEKWKVPIEQVYSPDIQKMFSWAINAPDYKFQF